jgi:hypothetical protein
MLSTNPLLALSEAAEVLTDTMAADYVGWVPRGGAGWGRGTAGPVGAPAPRRQLRGAPEAAQCRGAAARVPRGAQAPAPAPPLQRRAQDAAPRRAAARMTRARARAHYPTPPPARARRSTIPPPNPRTRSVAAFCTDETGVMCTVLLASQGSGAAALERHTVMHGGEWAAAHLLDGSMRSHIYIPDVAAATVGPARRPPARSPQAPRRRLGAATGALAARPRGARRARRATRQPHPNLGNAP